MGIQDASRKVKGSSQEPGPWAGTMTRTTEEVCGLFSQYRWDKVMGFNTVLGGYVKQGRKEVRQI